MRAIEKAFDYKVDHLVALLACVESQKPMDVEVNSSKSMIGHCLGAAAGVEAKTTRKCFLGEAVVTVQALKRRKVVHRVPSAETMSCRKSRSDDSDALSKKKPPSKGTAKCLRVGFT